MASFDFDFGTVYDCASRIKAIAEIIEQEGNKVKSLSGTVETGWTGAGSAEYLSYLQSVQNNIFARAQSLYNISDMLNGIAYTAQETDKEAARQIADTSSASVVTQQTNESTAANNTSANNTSAVRINSSQKIQSNSIFDNVKSVQSLKDFNTRLKKKGK